MSDRTVEQIAEAIDDCRGASIRVEEQCLVSTLQIVDYNRLSLEEDYGKLRQDASRGESPPVSPECELEFLQSFRNYVSSLYTLYEHGKRYRNKFFCSHTADGDTCEECDTVNLDSLRDTGVLPEWTLIKKLRVYTDHYRLPLLRGHLAFVGDDVGRENLLTLNRDGEIVLNEQRFLAWADETNNRDADDYVADADEIAPVTTALELYDAQEEYYQWLFTEVEDRNREELDEYNRLVRELKSKV